MRVSTFGPELMQLKVDTMKYRLFGEVIDQSVEAATYNPTLLEYVGKSIAISVIPSGADFWADQVNAITTTGTQESKSYVDRAAALWKLHAQLLRELAEMQPEVDALLRRRARRRGSMPTVNTTGPFITPDPHATVPLSAVPTWARDPWTPA